MTRRNLFYVDTQEIERTLAEANAGLVSRSKELIAAADRMPESLTSDGAIEKAVKFSKIVSTHIKDCRAARLGDEQSFKDAVKTVEKFFSAFEKPLRAIQGRILSAIGAAEAEKRKQANISVEDKVIAKSANETPIVVSQIDAGTENVELEWVVEAIDRNTLDLEVLRPYISEYALAQAAKKFLKENGPREIQGVKYGRRAKV